MRYRSILTFVLALFTTLMFTACTTTSDPVTEPEPDAPVVLPDLTAGEWTVLEGGDGTLCANGSDYSFYATPGTVNKLVIDFQGGGACWNGSSCSSPYGDPNPAVGLGFYFDQITADITTSVGIYQRDNAANPVKDWYHVYLPYCTGDLHIGNTTQTYTDPSDASSYSVEHKGAVNALAALDWTFANFSAPESIFITGCSAGAYGAAFWTGTIATQYPDADIYQLGDCGAGVATDAWAAELATNWNTVATFPEQTFDTSFVSSTYAATLAAQGDLNMAQYHTLFDGVQILYYSYGTKNMLIPSLDTGLEWSNKMVASLDALEASSDRFVSYVSLADTNNNLADGTQHCIIVHDDFYTLEVDGLMFRDWLDDYVNGREVASVRATLTAF